MSAYACLLMLQFQCVIDCHKFAFRIRNLQSSCQKFHSEFLFRYETEILVESFLHFCIFEFCTCARIVKYDN